MDLAIKRHNDNAVDYAAALIRERGRNFFGIAIHKAATEFNVNKQLIKEELQRRAAMARVKKNKIYKNFYEVEND